MKEKHSQSPGPRAKEISPAPKGDEYSYIVEKYWRIAKVLEDGQLLLTTRRGKQYTMDANDPRLRSPNLWERLFLRHRFPEQTSADAPSRTAE